MDFTDLETLANHRHPSTKSLVRYFAYDHLPAQLQWASAPFAQLVYDILSLYSDDSPELTVGLRKLLEAKDCVVRAALDLPLDLPDPPERDRSEPYGTLGDDD